MNHCQHARAVFFFIIISHYGILLRLYLCEILPARSGKDLARGIVSNIENLSSAANRFSAGMTGGPAILLSPREFFE
jgi:hypothetical protein